MSQPDSPRPSYGQQRHCSSCGTRVAQKAQTCFFCGALLGSAPRRRISLPWADFVLFAAIAAVLVIWWLRAPTVPDSRQESLIGVSLDALPGTPAILAQLIPEEILPSPTPTATATPRVTETPASTSTPAPTDLPLTPTPAPPSGPVRYKVVKGDNVTAIAARFGSTIKDIIEANGLPANGRLGIGQELIIPVAGPSGGPGPTTVAPVATQNPGVIYTVSSGDTLSSIAKRFASQVDWIRSANNMKADELLAVGRALLVPGSASLAAPTSTPAPELVAEMPLPTLEPGLVAPALLSPANSTILTGEDSVLLSWTSVAVLQLDEWYVVTLRSMESDAPVATHWTRSTTWRLPNDYRGTGTAGVDYGWRVQVRQGSEELPGPQVSPSSIERRFTWR